MKYYFEDVVEAIERDPTESRRIPDCGCPFAKIKPFNSVSSIGTPPCFLLAPVRISFGGMGAEDDPFSPELFDMENTATSHEILFQGCAF